MKKAVLFDFDFTLADASVGIIQCVNGALTAMGHENATEIQVKKTIGLPLEDMFSTYTGIFDADSRTIFRNHFTRQADHVITKNTHFFEDAIPVLKALKSKRFKVAIVSTKYRYHIEEVLVRDDLMTTVDLVIGGEDVKRHKPDPEAIILAIEKLGITAEEAFFVGDTFMDQGAAKGAGMDFLAVLNGTTTRKDFEGNGVPSANIAENLTQVLTIVSV